MTARKSVSRTAAPLDPGGVLYGPYQSDHPSRHGLREWNFDPINTSATAAGQVATAGQPLLMKLFAQTGGTVNNILAVLGTAGTLLTTNQNFAGLYDDTGARIGVTADQTSIWMGTTGTKTMALASPATVQIGRDYFVAILSNGSTGASFLPAATNTLTATPNVNLGNAALRFAVNGTGQTSLPTSLTLANNTATGSRPFWVGLS